MKRNAYEIEKNIERILRGQSTGFLPLNIAKEIQNKLKKNTYQIFAPYKEAEKIILTGGTPPNIRLYKIIHNKDTEIQHSAILGSLFGLNITSEMFGDIVFYNNNFYVYFLENISTFIENNFFMVGRIQIQLEEVENTYLENYQRNYQSLQFIVSSPRIDSIISKIINCNREKTQLKIHEKQVLLNGEVLSKTSYILQEQDTFSIKGYGKYRFQGTVGKTKKNRYIAVVDKYL